MNAGVTAALVHPTWGERRGRDNSKGRKPGDSKRAGTPRKKQQPLPKKWDWNAPEPDIPNRIGMDLNQPETETWKKNKLNEKLRRLRSAQDPRRPNIVPGIKAGSSNQKPEVKLEKRT